MLILLRKIRRQMLGENKFLTYLAYAVGETILVVVGILIAIQVDDWNRQKELHQEELESYELIITDLKRDSVLFGFYIETYSAYLDNYFKLNRITQGQSNLNEVMPDFLVSNAQFSPVTQSNHQVTIEKLRDREIRDRINAYFGRLNQVKQATDEFNAFIARESRPFFLKENEIFKNDAVFDYEDRTFPPFKGVTTLDQHKLEQILDHPYFVPILSQLRMSIGFYLAALGRSIEENHQLIQSLESRLE